MCDKLEKFRLNFSKCTNRDVALVKNADCIFFLFFVSKARTNELAIEDMDGGTFTISNGGVFGSMMGTPIINPPQSSILGMHAIIDRPVAVNGKVSGIVQVLLQNDDSLYSALNLCF